MLHYGDAELSELASSATSSNPSTSFTSALSRITLPSLYLEAKHAYLIPILLALWGGYGGTTATSTDKRGQLRIEKINCPDFNTLVVLPFCKLLSDSIEISILARAGPDSTTSVSCYLTWLTLGHRLCCWTRRARRCTSRLGRLKQALLDQEKLSGTLAILPLLTSGCLQQRTHRPSRAYSHSFYMPRPEQYGGQSTSVDLASHWTECSPPEQRLRHSRYLRGILSRRE